MAKGKRVLKKLLSLGWTVIRQKGSHRRLVKLGCQPLTFSYHDSEELGKIKLAQLAKEAGCKPEDLI